MLRVLFVAVALAVATTATAAYVTGYLVSDTEVTTVTGRQAHRCVYSVEGEEVTIMLPTYCPYTYNFQ